MAVVFQTATSKKGKKGTLPFLQQRVTSPFCHLGVWEFDVELKVWGVTRYLPNFCFIVETVAPGLLVIKQQHSHGAAKFVNVAGLEGDQIKVLNHEFSTVPSCPSILGTLLGLSPASPNSSDSQNVLIRLAVSMRDHGRGGTLLVVPSRGNSWREPVSHPLTYSVSPPYSELSSVVREAPAEGENRRWREDRST